MLGSDILQQALFFFSLSFDLLRVDGILNTKRKNQTVEINLDFITTELK
jgi:hypothetical protein